MNVYERQRKQHKEECSSKRPIVKSMGRALQRNNSQIGDNSWLFQSADQMIFPVMIS